MVALINDPVSRKRERGLVFCSVQETTLCIVETLES